MAKQNVTYVGTMGCYLSTKRESADTHYNMDEPWKYHAKKKKPATKDNILFKSIYKKCPEEANL